MSHLTFAGCKGTVYKTGRLIGKGGEGAVYDIADHPDLVLKKYNEPLSGGKVDKLNQLLLLNSPAIQAFAALPTDLVKDDTGAVCGFAMKKLSGYVPLHSVFSPMDRKKMFPDKGYNFLAHIARNLAIAFHKLHQAGLVVGDVNEGNILINASGYICFIDCDSFQVARPDGGYYFCEVGVPRYTPPELLTAGTFETAVRTTNTDCFSMAVLIFQLLFLGRHPYAGKNATANDIDEETAIKSREFAYSLTRKRKKLHPPNDSFDIANLPDKVIELFHQAFQEAVRPTAQDWIQALDELIKEMKTCGLTSLHSYPGRMDNCPWCTFRKNRGIMYFLDDSYLQAGNALRDIDSFVNGFRVEKLELSPWVDKNAGILLPPVVVEAELRTVKYYLNGACFATVLAGLLLMLAHPVCILAAFAGPYLLWQYSGWRKLLIEASEKVTTESRRLHERIKILSNEYYQPGDLDAYRRETNKLEHSVNNFRNLPQFAEKKRREMEEQVYNEQLNYYLACFKIEHNVIPAIGEVKKAALLQHGIIHAADISKLQVLKVPGIGPKNYQVLLAWQRQIAQGFIYIPDKQKLDEGIARVNQEVQAAKANLEQKIRSEYQNINFAKNTILNKCIIVEKQLNELSLKAREADQKVLAYNKLAYEFFY